MTFWLIVAAVVLAVLLLSWRHDRKRRGSVRGDIGKKTDAGVGTSIGKGQAAGGAATRGTGQAMFPGPR